MNKKIQRRVLGRGLSALIPAAAVAIEDSKAGGEEITHLETSLIYANPFQPRRNFDEEEIKSLAESIRSQGLLQPVLVRKKENGTYEIISGERRFRALIVLGKEKIPCLIKPNLSDREMMEMALVENIQREDLNEIEKAEAYQKLLQEYDYTHDQLAKQVGKSRTVITNSLRLLGLPEEIRQMVRMNIVTMGHARALLSLDDDIKRMSLAKKIQEEGLSVREVEKAVQPQERKKNIDRLKPTDQKIIDSNLAAALNKLEYLLGTPVKIKAKTEHQGKIEIEYFSEKDLTRIFDVLLLEKETNAIE
jgi:ParB family transcriptional regulator, chromosome partitioning protein